MLLLPRILARSRCFINTYSKKNFHLSTSKGILKQAGETLILFVSPLKFQVKPKDCKVVSESLITVSPGVSGKTTLYYQLQFLKEKIGRVVIKGLPTVNSAVIQMDDSGGGKPNYKLFVEGDNLREVLATQGEAYFISITSKLWKSVFSSSFSRSKCQADDF